MNSSDRCSLLQFVRNTPLFSGLADSSFQLIGPGIRFLNLVRGANLFDQDEPANRFYVVIEGWVKAFRTDSTGNEATIDIITRGQSVAEIAALANEYYPANSVAISDVQLAEIPIQPIHDAIYRDAQVAMAMLTNASRQEYRLMDEIEKMKGLTGSQRVIEFLIQLSPTGSGSARIRLPYEKTVIAQKVGLKAESLSRVFKKLQKYGVTIEHDMATVEDVAILRRALASGTPTQSRISDVSYKPATDCAGGIVSQDVSVGKHAHDINIREI